MSIDPDVIHAEPHAEIGYLLQRDAGILIHRWSRRAIQEQPHAVRAHHQALVDHLGDFLQALGCCLAESEHDATAQHRLTATIHGEDRWQTGWSLVEVVRDYQILRLVILEYLAELEVSLSPRATMAIGLVLDEAIAASVAIFVANREDHLRQLQDERAERDRQIQEHLRHRAETLREVDRRKNEFMATLGHEMRNPLAPLSHAVRLLELQETTDAGLLQVRDIINRQVQQLARLADDLLDISRIAQGKVELRKEPVEIRTIIAQAVQMSEPHLKARHHHLEVALPPAPLRLEADSARLVQVVVNLLNNAAKYTEPGGRIWVSAAHDKEDVVIRVRDTGVGIREEMLPHVFELFTQGEWSQDGSQGGMGIGLALVRRLVELHGGTITATSTGRGKGSEFLVRLPALSAEMISSNGSTHRGGEIAVLSAAKMPPRRILIVDDNVDGAKMLSMLLSRDGHNVRVAYDGLSALRIAEESQLDVILLDIGMPLMNGYEVARRLGQRVEMQTVLLVAVTGYGQDGDRRRCQEAGFHAHLIKPVDLSALKAVLLRCPAQIGSSAGA